MTILGQRCSAHPRLRDTNRLCLVITCIELHMIESCLYVVNNTFAYRWLQRCARALAGKPEARKHVIDWRSVQRSQGATMDATGKMHALCRLLLLGGFTCALLELSLESLLYLALRVTRNARLEPSNTGQFMHLTCRCTGSRTWRACGRFLFFILATLNIQLVLWHCLSPAYFIKSNFVSFWVECTDCVSRLSRLLHPSLSVAPSLRLRPGAPLTSAFPTLLIPYTT